MAGGGSSDIRVCAELAPVQSTATTACPDPAIANRS